ncbi:hypothetical protein H6F67_22195 [Microcoleus sp. FACHB-1515]|uniref:hypothetical protein n=1 Tax=Cyanophyceae TaxID=3028117 RepID=UPI00168507C8|nr:hypothetical protein [Microcoleus sp. FACHB-1515]MBD2092563.1 hypothetical protein [Microcoleus sp. FACHB-1515]
MSSFNPQKYQRSAAEWQEIARETNSEVGAQFTIIGGVVLGLFAAAAASPVTGLLVAGYFGYKAWQDTQAANRNDSAIDRHGCIAHLLKASDLKDYSRQVGAEVAAAEITFAIENGYRVTNAAIEFLEMCGVDVDALMSPALPAAKSKESEALAQPLNFLESEIAALAGEDAAVAPEPPQVSPNQFEPIEPPATIDIPVEDVPSLQPPSTQLAAMPTDSRTSTPTNDLFAWSRDLLHFPAVLIWGPQGSGKTSFAAWLLHQRIAAGHLAWICDPHKEYGQWKGLKVVGAGMDYVDCDRAMLKFANTVKQAYKARAEQANYKPTRETVLVEEFTNWASRCDNSAEFFTASLSDLRKIKKGVIFVSHDRSLIALGNAKGFSKARNNGLLELFLEATIDPATGEPMPAMRGKLKYPGKAAIEVEISPEMCGSMDFTQVGASPPLGGIEAASAIASDEQQRLREKLEGLYRETPANDAANDPNDVPNDAQTNSKIVPERPNDANEIRTNLGTGETTQPQGFEAFYFSPERIAERFGGTTERTLFEVVRAGFENGLAPNEIVKQSLKLGRDRYQEGKALSVYLVRKYGQFDLLMHFKKWLEEG